MHILRELYIYRAIQKIVVCSVVFSFIAGSLTLPRTSYAQSVLKLPAPGTMVSLSPSFNPALMLGITIHPQDPFLFDFIIDSGDDNLEGKDLEKESMKLIKYFMAALTIPEDEMWVNLSPYEKDRIIPNGFGDTQMGRDLLAQDYLLKQITASLMYPEKELGDNFWKRVYKKAQDKYGTSDVPMNTFNKVWIVPDKAVIHESGMSVFVVESHLKVMLEEDYLALEENVGNTKHGMGDIAKDDLTQISDVSLEVIREIIIPEIEKEVNEGKAFSSLRQIANSTILATWYKQNVQQSILHQIYVDKSKTSGIDTTDKAINQKIYNQYVEAFKKGVYSFIKEDYDQSTQEIIPRKYFSGGVLNRHALTDSFDAAALDSDSKVSSFRVRLENNDAARTGKDLEGQTAMSLVDTIMREIISDEKYQSHYRIRKGKLRLRLTGLWKVVDYTAIEPIDSNDDISLVSFLDGKAIKVFEATFDDNKKKGRKGTDNYQFINLELWEDIGDIQRAEDKVRLKLTSFLKMRRQYLDEGGSRSLDITPGNVLNRVRDVMVSKVNEFRTKEMKGEFKWQRSKNREGTYQALIQHWTGEKKSGIGIFFFFDEKNGILVAKRGAAYEIDIYDIAPDEEMFIDLETYWKESVSSNQLMYKVERAVELFIVERSTPISASDDSASIGNAADVGGIDFNPNIYDFETRGSKGNFDFEFNNQPSVSSNINGLIPVIINVTPNISIPLLLGVSEEQSEQERQQLTSI